MTLPAPDGFILPVDAFVRAVDVNSDVRHDLFLGAGASITSGVRSADGCIWDWKRDLFLTNNPGLERQFEDVSLLGVRARIQLWLDRSGNFPPRDAPDEYGFYAERAYPISQDRRQYFQGLGQRARPFVGYELLCLLAEADLFGAVWTTNFDGLVPRAAAVARITVVEVGLDTPDRVTRQTRKGELLHVALHGDYRYDALKNTPAELQAQDAQLRAALVRRLADANLIVVGYSGRDQSVMDTLNEAYAQPGAGRLYWCGRQGSEPRGPVRELIAAARASHREAFFIPIEGFDDLMGRLALHCLAGRQRARAEELRATLVMRTEPPPFRVGTGAARAIVKSNAFPVELPSEVLQFEAPVFTGEGTWTRLRERTRGTDIVAAPTTGKVLALGTMDQIRAVFGADVRGEVRRVPLDERDLRVTNGVITSLLAEALTRAVATMAELESDGRDLIWLPEPRGHRTLLGVTYGVHDAALLALRRYAGRSYPVIKPTITSFGPDGSRASEDADRELKRLVLTRQYNREFSDTLNAWRRRLFGRTTVFEFPPHSGSSFRFTVRRNPVFATVSNGRDGRGVSVPAAIQGDVALSGVQRQEPALAFSDGHGQISVTDQHPLRGLVENRPYDYALTLTGLSRHVRLGVVCPRADAPRLASFIGRLHTRAEATSKAPYLVDRPVHDEPITRRPAREPRACP